MCIPFWIRQTMERRTCGRGQIPTTQRAAPQGEAAAAAVVGEQAGVADAADAADAVEVNPGIAT